MPATPLANIPQSLPLSGSMGSFSGSLVAALILSLDKHLASVPPDSHFHMLASPPPVTPLRALHSPLSESVFEDSPHPCPGLSPEVQSAHR